MGRLLLILTVLAVILAFATSSEASMKLYKKNPGSNKYRPVLKAVSSTVIPLDDLPTFTVSSLLGPASEAPPAGVTKPAKPTKLITASRKKPYAPPKKVGASTFDDSDFAGL
ncbi:uncharacterized protein LOC108665161 [Hyalella azteca]|uniref:Uncharacterized protein LOC108665161 n=1 Tax=Hyalella azteca TaxID=294128 RepID=A0A8B7N1E7_HYAAZ|nr:uncharacterized protein LOC108665161 [Hyalella azteca]